MNTPQTMLRAALGYARRGWQVIPLHYADPERPGGCSCGRRDCSSPGKHPQHQLVPHGLKGGTTDPVKIQDWWRRVGWNIGIVTGEASGVVVLDVDPKNGGTDTLEALIRQYGDFTATYAVVTGSGGAHFYFRHPGFAVRNQAGSLGDGIDVRGDGGYVVAPPSNHVQGAYQVQGEGGSLWPLPAWIATRDASAGENASESASAPKVVSDVIPKGRQHHTLVSMAGSMRRRGASEDEMFALLDVMRHRCEEVPPSSHMRRIAETVASYAPDEAFDVAAGLDEAPEGEGLDHVGDALMDLTKRLERAVVEGGMMGLPTGLSQLDEMTGGFHGGDLIVVGARPSMGKSSLARTLAVNQAEQCAEGEGIGTFSVEMSRDAYLLQMMGAAANVDSHRFRTGEADDADLARAVRAAGKLDSLPLYLNARAGVTVAQIAAMCRTREAEGTRLRAVYVDYLQLITAASRDGRRFNREDEAIASVSMGLKALAKDLDTPVIALAQLNRAVESRGDKIPTLADLRASGQIEQDADVVLFIHRPERAGETHLSRGLGTVTTDGLAILRVAKQRLGPVGDIDVFFDKPRTRFVDMAQRWTTEGRPIPAGQLIAPSGDGALLEPAF